MFIFASEKLSFLQTKTKHIIIAYFFVALIQLPSIWQLEHLFDNDHGVLYHSSHSQFQKIDNSCGSLHKQLNYVYWFNGQIFHLDLPRQYYTIAIDLPQVVSTKILRHFSLRAPPLS
jgi:hypothetical protein